MTIGGDIINKDGPQNSTGFVYSTVETFTLRGSLIGGTLGVSNPAFAPIKSVSIGGSIVARDGFQGSGVLTVASSAKTTITVKGSIVGGEYTGWLSPNSSGTTAAGAIIAEGSVGTINIGGSIHGGTIDNANPAVNGGISVNGNLGRLNIGGSVLGYNNDPVLILVTGSTFGVPAGTPAIGKVSIKGNATHAYIAAGTRMANNGMAQPQVFDTFNPDASIGSVFIGGNFVNSNILAGVKDGGSLGVNNTAVADTLNGVGKLGPVVIKGTLFSDRDADYSGFAADVIASITVAGRKVFKAGDGLRNFDTYITAKEL